MQYGRSAPGLGGCLYTTGCLSSALQTSPRVRPFQHVYHFKSGSKGLQKSLYGANFIRFLYVRTSLGLQSAQAHDTLHGGVKMQLLPNTDDSGALAFQGLSRA